MEKYDYAKNELSGSEVIRIDEFHQFSNSPYLYLDHIRKIFIYGFHVFPRATVKRWSLVAGHWLLATKNGRVSLRASNRVRITM